MRVIRWLSFAVAAVVVACVALPATATDYFVRQDGSDSCDGRANVASGGGGSCAFRTVGRGNQVAGCGDTVRIAAGDFHEGVMTISSACPDATPKRFVGAGYGSTTWFAGAVDVNDAACTPDAANAGVYKCPQPAGTGTQYSPASCIIQRHTTSVFFQDENGVKGDMVGPACLTRNTSGAADVRGKEGNYFQDGTNYWIRPWDDRDPRTGGSGGTDLVAAVSSCTTTESIAIRLTGSNLELRDLTVITPCYQAIGMPSGSRRTTLENVRVFGGMIWAYAGAQDVTIRHAKVMNSLRRPDNQGAVSGDVWNTHSQCMATSATRFTYEDIETYACREGFGISNGANNGTIDGLFIHGSYNHGLKIIDTTTHDVVIRDVLTYNNLEPLFIECPYNIRIENSTFPFSIPGGCAIIQGNPGGCPADRPQNIDFYNNVIDCLLWHNYGGDTWAKGGHDLDYNTYISDNERGFVVRNVAQNKSMSLTEWQNWTGSTCSTCTRDPHSRAVPRAQVFKRYLERDDRLNAGYDFDLRTDSPAVGGGSTSWGDGIDIEGISRSTPRDPGAYDHLDSTTPACSDGLDNDGDGAIDHPADFGCAGTTDADESSTVACGDGADNDGDGKKDQQDTNCSGATDSSESSCGDGVREPGAESCDGSDLGGQSCVGLGFLGGTLRCSPTCQYDTSSCTSNVPPQTPENLHRTDTK